MKIHEKIAYLRKQKNLTQGQLAIKLDISRQAVYKWEAGESLPELDKIHRISTIFGVSSDFLIDDSLAISDLDNYLTDSDRGIKKKRKSNKLSIILTSFFAVFMIATITCLTLALIKLYNNDNEGSNPQASNVTGPFLVNFALPDGTVISTQRVPTNDVPRIPESPTLAGQSFEGWYLNGAPYTGQVITQNTYIYAKYSTNSYEIAYNLNGGSLDYRAESSYTVFDEVALIEPTKQGYSFLGWYSGSSKIEKIEKGSAKDYYLEAKWELANYKINYELNGGENSIYNPATFTIAEGAALRYPTSDYLEFQGWYLEDDFKTPITNIEKNQFFSDITVYAKWKMPYFEFEKSYNKQSYILAKFEDTTATECIIPAEFCGLPVSTVSQDAFSECKRLEKIHISRAITYITVFCFDDLEDLKEITVDENNTVYSSQDGILFSFDKSALICYPKDKDGASYEVPSSVTKIGSHAFAYSSKLVSIKASESLTSIESSAFFRCPLLQSVDFDGLLDKIPSGAFSGCSSLVQAHLNVNGAIESNAFFGCTSLEQIGFGAHISSIGDSAFKGCTSLKSAIFHAGAAQIEQNAFYGCTQLKSINILASCKKIGKNAFYGCTQLNSVSLPFGLTDIEEKAFYNCVSLKSIELPDSVSFISAYAFSGCTSLNSVTINKEMNWSLFCKQTTVYEKSRLTIEERSSPDTVAAFIKDNPSISLIASAPEYITITYQTAYGELADTTVRLEKGEIYANHPLLFDEKHAFLGWYDLENGSNDDTIIDLKEELFPVEPENELDFSRYSGIAIDYQFTKDTTLVASWEEIPLCEGGTEHIFGDVYYTEPSCTEKGLRQRECESCGKVLKEFYKHSLGHSLSSATVDLGSYIGYPCQRAGCNYIKNSNKTSYSYSVLYTLSVNISITGASTDNYDVLKNYRFDESDEDAITANGTGDNITVTYEGIDSLGTNRIVIKGRGNATFKVYFKYEGYDEYTLIGQGNFLTDEENEQAKRAIPFFTLTPHYQSATNDEGIIDTLEPIPGTYARVCGIQIVIENPSENDFLEEIGLLSVSS